MARRNPLHTGSIGTAEVADSSLGAADLGDDALTPVDVEGLAHTAATVRARIPLQITLEFDAADFDANDDLSIDFPDGHAALITNIKTVCGTAEGGALTLTLRTAADGAGNAISSALNLNSTSQQQTTTLANNAVAAGATIYGNASANPGTVAGGLLIIDYVHTT